MAGLLVEAEVCVCGGGGGDSCLDAFCMDTRVSTVVRCPSSMFCCSFNRKILFSTCSSCISNIFFFFNDINAPAASTVLSEYWRP